MANCFARSTCAVEANELKSIDHPLDPYRQEITLSAEKPSIRTNVPERRRTMPAVRQRDPLFRPKPRPPREGFIDREDDAGMPGQERVLARNMILVTRLSE